MNHPDTASKTSFLHKFLVESGYKPARHLLLVVIIIVISLNQAFMTFRSGLDTLGSRVYLQAFLLCLSYLLTGYFNLYFLLPRYLLKKEYARYTLLLTISVFLLVALQTVEERYLLTHSNISNESYDFPGIYLNNLSAFALVFLSLSGAAVTILLRHWLTESERVEQLEKRHAQAEVERLKEQVNPHLLFNVLNRVGVLATHQPGQASDMLIKLSQLLRYQLYDCNREQVLLSSEVKFLSNYLALEQAYSHTFRFTVQEDQHVAYILVAPLLFISFVQAAIIRLYEMSQETTLTIDFTATDNGITFCCNSRPAPLFDRIDYSKVIQRIDILYAKRYSLITTAHQLTLNLKQ